MTYLVVKCRGCGRLLLTRSAQKSRLCAYCGRKNLIKGAASLARAATAKGAQLLLQQMKKAPKRGETKPFKPVQGGYYGQIEDGV